MLAEDGGGPFWEVLPYAKVTVALLALDAFH
jgi:hypothetical protein